jgi:hypothetical protein
MDHIGRIPEPGAEIRLPRNDGFDPQIGAYYEGDVLTGKLSAKDSIQREADRSGLWDTIRSPCSPDDYDPVLRHHLRIRESGE